VKKAALFFLLIFRISGLWSGEPEGAYQARVSQRIAELELEDALALWITDTDTGEPVAGALVAIENAGSTRTDQDGLAVFPVLEEGAHSFIVQKEGYIIVKDAFTVFGGSLFFNKFSIPKIMPPKHLKIVLDWGASPGDLDAHVVKENSYHISYRDMKQTADGTAWLDRDDTDRYGPETITIAEADERSRYQFYVHNYSDRNQANNTRLSASKAVVRVYADNRLAQVFHVKPNIPGTIWRVFEITNGTIRWIDKIDSNE
jgi:hypothetical protein